MLRFRRHWKAPLQLCGATSGLCARICLVEVRVWVTSEKKEGEEAFVVLQRKQILGFLLLAHERSG